MNDLKSPWKLKNPEPCFFTVEDNDGNDFIHFNNHEFGEGNFDDIRHQALCAVAAPEMYELLSEISMASENPRVNLNGYLSDWTDRINSVLKKARGE